MYNSTIVSLSSPRTLGISTSEVQFKGLPCPPDLIALQATGQGILPACGLRL